MSLSLIIFLVLIGFLTGLSKTAIGGIGTVNAALLATFLPAKESTGVMLILLLTGDLFAIGIYKKHVEWNVLKKLMLPILAGVFAGAFFLQNSTNESLRKTIGWIVIFLVISFPITQKLQRGSFDVTTRYPKFLGASLGLTSGFMSMVANIGGAPMSIYLLLRKNSVMNFLGNTAWLFFLVNLFKIPFALTLGLLNFDSFYYIFPALPAVAVGAIIGRKLVSKINQKLFQRLTLVTAALAGLNLILG
jgi:hypothetical protein